MYYALKGLDHDEITRLPKSRIRSAISKGLPEDLRDTINPKDLKLSFEKMDDYTEMKVEVTSKDIRKDSSLFLLTIWNFGFEGFNSNSKLLVFFFRKMRIPIY